MMGWNINNNIIFILYYYVPICLMKVIENERKFNYFYKNDL